MLYLLQEVVEAGAGRRRAQRGVRRHSSFPHTELLRPTAVGEAMEPAGSPKRAG